MYINLPSLEEYLGSFSNLERHPDKRSLKLKTMSILCEYFGHPESVCPCFHVAGSKGKGTIASGIAMILRSMGYKTGVYSSPHVYHFTERISDGSGAFSQEIYRKAEAELKSGIEALTTRGDIKKENLTWFELVTIFAMLVFREAKVDYSIYEVGMGGRLDTTNIIQPLAIGMGPIELEHTKILGDTLAQIAAEKAGVFKPGIPVISAPQDAEVQEVFKSYAAKNHTIVKYLEDADYQILDARIAAECAHVAFPELDIEKSVSIALSASLPGRYELIKDYHGIPYLLMDGAHTENSIKKVLARMKKDGFRGHLIFACAADKNVEKIARAIVDSGLFLAIYVTRPGDFKKSDFTRAKEAFESTHIKVYADPDFQKLIKQALEDSKKANLPCASLGSFYLPEQIKNIVK